MEQELKQEGATTEQPKEEISKETPKVTLPEEKKTSERTYSEIEWRKMQSMKDKADATLKNVETQLQELRKRTGQQALEVRQKEIQALDGEPDEQAKLRRKHQLEDEVNKLNEVKSQQEGAVQRKYDQALELAAQHGLSLSDARELMAAETPKEMELLAQIKVAEQEKDAQKSTGPSPDSATSDAAPSDFKQLEKNFIADPYKYGKQYKEALAKRGQ